MSIKRSAFDNTRDQRVADESGIPQALMCHAHGCPNRWTVTFGGPGLCSAHAWVDPDRWPEITQQQQWDETERARMRGEPKGEPYVEPMSYAEKRALIAKLGKVGSPA